MLRLVSRGLANKQIGRALGISERTVKVHPGNVCRRIGVQDRTSAALWARENLPVSGGVTGAVGSAAAAFSPGVTASTLAHAEPQARADGSRE